MKYYPVNLDIKDKPCLVVGGGSVAERKVNTLLECGAKVTVTAPNVSDAIAALGKNGKIQLKIKAYESSDLKDIFLVIGATDDKDVNYNISKTAKEYKALCNIADCPEQCDFILPSIINRGDLIISVSTSGNSPAFAKKLRKELEKQFGEEYAIMLKLLGSIRKKLLSEAHEPEAHKKIFEQMINSQLLELIRINDLNGIKAIFKQILDKYECEEIIETVE